MPTVRFAGAGSTGEIRRMDPGRRPRSWVDNTQGARGSRLRSVFLLS
ncbi:hypothetical protein [Sphaerisporangium rubeum]|uniref:Uncharacterized protein n=1 Tax=Sphaerisporangium rubeum TaxID=321317 RepID=A0A7X0MAA9_9ACTN|nr:hypothetical protein [Sphaerisporangium rubeum]MBB6475894.1 hypothetical protein [Sphaerisporangium rubeum]